MLCFRNKIMAVLMAATVLAVGGSVEARINLTPVQEQQVGKWQIRDAGAAYLEVSPALATIQNELIFSNLDRLCPYRNNNSRGLRPPHLLCTNDSRVSAYSVPGGHTFVSDAMVTAFLSRDFDPYTGVSTGERKELDNGYELYGHSALAAALAHEASHWERNFLQQETDVITARITSAKEVELRHSLQTEEGRRYSAKLDELGFSPSVLPGVKEFIHREELASDEGAMEFMDNTEFYSPGSLMTVISRLRDSVPDAKKISHPSNALRKQQVGEHINRLSQGRVQLDEAGCMKLDGKLFLGTGYLPARHDVSAYDRTAYVAGQLAKSIHYNVRRLIPLDDDSTISCSSGMVPLMAVCGDGPGRRFVIDKFAVTKSAARALVAGQEAGYGPEIKAAAEISAFLRK